MSNTIVTNFSNSSGAKAEKPLVIIVNKDGTVCLEKNTVQSLLAKKEYENAPVSIVRMSEDGKPDDASDHSSDDTVPHVNLSVDAFYDSSANGARTEYLTDLFDSGTSLIGFQNDHCYTPLTSPVRNREADGHRYKLENENVQPKQYIPSSKKITVLESKIIPKGKSVQYFNTSGACEILKGTDVIKRTSNMAPHSSHSVKKIDADGGSSANRRERSDDPGIEPNENPSEEESADEDPDSDSDFDPILPDNMGFESRSKKSKSSLRRDLKKIISRKIEMKNNGVLGVQSHSILEDGKIRKVTKTYHKPVDERGRHPSSQRSSDGKQISNVRKLSADGESSKSSHKLSDSKNDPNKNAKLAQRKDRKHSAHDAALLNDMTSLFSTPDVIRRVSTDSKSGRSHDKQNSLLRKSDSSAVFSASDKRRIDSKSYPSNASKLHTKDVLQSNKNPKECLDVMHSLDDVNLVQLLQDTNAGILSSDNIPIVLNPIQMQTSPMEKHDPNLIVTNANMLMTPVSMNSNVLNGPLSPNLDILSGLQPDEEGLTEDLLRHVAQLVESSENLQEVIDKQVLGKINTDITPKSVSKPMHSLPDMIPPQLIAEPTNSPISPAISKKEPIKVVRKDGVVITLPPIEAPATRSSKRKSLLNANIEQNVNAPVVDVNKPAPIPQIVDPKPSHPNKPNQKSDEGILQMMFDKKEDDVESDQSWNSEDDPDRLWCICKQPHNNRFMICCDLCEDWFHGKCVNITKAIGKEMEIKGVEWRCPNCIKKGFLANPNVKAMQHRKSTESRQSIKSNDDKNPKVHHNVANHSDSNTSCIVCKKPARASSIYCSDACILKHAQESLIIASPPSNANFKTAKDTQNKSKQETRVIVYERKTGKFLAGPSAPTTGNLKTWLQEHPTYEVVRPGTVAGNRQFPAAKSKQKPVPSKVQTVLSVGQDKQISYTQSGLKSPTAQQKSAPKPIVQTQLPNIKSPTTNKPQTVRPPLKSPTTPKAPTVQPKTPTVKSPTSPIPQRSDERTPRRSSIDPIRENVRKALQEQISLRMGETKDVKFSQEEIIKFSTETEFELHDLFKDVGAKYKAKYRSLMFNLKDRKNLTLWQKICDRSITPKQLVRLSPEELASQELAQWRNKETKHQLELIKKSELDLLACNKTYVLKTHKGEEVMESQLTGTAELDPNVSVEDIVTELNKSVDGGGEPIDSSSRPATPVTSSHDTRHSSSHHKHSRHKSRSHRSSKSTHSSRNDKSSKHSSSKDVKSDNRSHHRRSSRDKVKSDRKDRSSRRHSRSRRHSSHSRSKSRTKQSEAEKKRSKSNDRRRSISSSRDENKSQSSKELEYKPSSINNSDKMDMEILKIEDVKSPVIYDDNKSSSQGNVSNFLREMRSPFSNSSKTLAGGESDQEPSSTVDSILSVVWTGCINMIEVAKFNVTAHEVSGASDDVIFELDSDLDVVGRIRSDMVWDYISKMKKQSSKDILVLRFMPANDDEKSQYMTLYTYLYTRNRLGVIRVNVGGIKDFYILPLPSRNALPSVLLPIHGPGFEDSRPDLLLGIIVKQRRKRGSQIPPTSNIPSKSAKLANADRSFTTSPEGSYTPPPESPRRKLPALSSSSGLSSMPLPGFSSSADDDEPYSPGGSDSGSLGQMTDMSVTSTALQRKMDELTRKIEEEKKQIQNIAVNISSNAQDEPYSPSRPMTPATAETTLPILSNISLPSNIHEILASIQSKTKSSVGETVDGRPQEPYIPGVVSNPTGDVDMRMLTSATIPGFTLADIAPKSAGKLSTLSEAELLSMVPDDEVLLPKNKAYPPLPTGGSRASADVCVPPPPYKKQRSNYGQPPPPGLDDALL